MGWFVQGQAMNPPMVEPSVTAMNYTDVEATELQGYLAVPTNSNATGPFPAVILIP